MGVLNFFPSVSPKKTIEGTLGGFIFALAAAYLMATFEELISPIQWMILATVIVVAGSLGDLIESKFKRTAGVKDSGAILPGHGGMLDRLDSFGFCSTVCIFNFKYF